MYVKIMRSPGIFGTLSVFSVVDIGSSLTVTPLYNKPGTVYLQTTWTVEKLVPNVPYMCSALSARVE